ncbi:hypothetical protein TRVL_02433 [Trypanosoma vivax]|nr:hypothetical protein TRVL_02433 [Trypanosoma vivax]
MLSISPVLAHRFLFPVFLSRNFLTEMAFALFGAVLAFVFLGDGLPVPKGNAMVIADGEGGSRFVCHHDVSGSLGVGSVLELCHFPVQGKMGSYNCTVFVKGLSKEDKTCEEHGGLAQHCAVHNLTLREEGKTLLDSLGNGFLICAAGNAPIESACLKKKIEEREIHIKCTGPPAAPGQSPQQAPVVAVGASTTGAAPQVDAAAATMETDAPKQVAKENSLSYDAGEGRETSAREEPHAPIVLSNADPKEKVDKAEKYPQSTEPAELTEGGAPSGQEAVAPEEQRTPTSAADKGDIPPNVLELAGRVGSYSSVADASILVFSHLFTFIGLSCL